MVDKPDWAAFESWLTEIMKRENVPGVSVGVSVRGKVVYAKGFGVADVATGRPVDENTVYGIASVSKSFAALSLMQLADEGEVDPLAPVVRYLPEFRMKKVDDIQSIWLHHCLSHTTGCPPLRRAQGEFTDFSEHLEYLAKYDMTMLGRPGEHISYCNDTFMLNGAIVERITGTKYSDFVRERIISPLKMSRSTFNTREVMQWDNVTNLYNLSSDGSALERQPWPDLGTYYVGGGIRSTVLDLLRYGSMYCAGGRAVDGDRIVSEAGIIRMRTPVHPSSEGALYCYAMWVTPAYHGVTLVEHSGGQPGVTARWGYIPEESMSAVVLTNLRGAPADQIYIALVNTCLGIAATTPRIAEAPTFPVERRELEMLTGCYQADEGMGQLEAKAPAGDSGRVIRVWLEGEGLLGEFDGQRYPLRMTAPDRAAYRHQGIDKGVRWHLRAGEPAWGISTGLQITRRALIDG